MSFLNKIWRMALVAFMLMALAPGKSIAQGQYISNQNFYDNLSPYGVWVYDPQYGDMWIPDVDGDFRPYATRGHWVLTEYGNTWVSDYPWGWATFHYGRWVFDDYYGWAWVPGYEWAPAWVSWRQTEGYYGWAPLTPNISVNLSFGGGYSIPDNYWVFAPQNYINSPRIYNYYVPHTRVVNIIRNTTIINNIYSRDNRRYIAGPRIQDIERVTRTRPRIYNINNANRPGAINVRNKTVNIYRPEVRRAADARPARVVDGNSYKRENPNASIARRAAGGAPAYNRENASKLANVARSATPNNNVVRVNRAGNNDRPGNDRANNDNRPGNSNDGRVRSGRPEARPNVNPRDAAQPADNRFDRRREANGAPNINNGQAQPGNIERNRGSEGRRRVDGSNRTTPTASAQQQDLQRQQQDAQRQQQREVQRQQRETQRQQQDAQRQQQREAQRQQRDIQRQQQDAQRQSQQNAQQDVQRQQRDAQRQQQDMQQRQARDGKRQAEQQQRQQQRQEQRQQRPMRQAMPGQ